jgi:hypothetical protein
MNCKQVRKHLPDLLVNELDKNIRREITDHLATCASCKKEWESMSSLWEKMAMLPEEQPSKRMHDRFYAMLEAYKQSALFEKTAARRSKFLDDWLERWWPQRPAVQFVLAVLLLALGLIIGTIFTMRGSKGGEIAQLREEVHDMKQLVTISLLEKQSAIERLRGVNLSYQIAQPDSQVLTALLDTLNYDPNVNVRLAAVDALYLFHDKKIVKEGLVQSFSNQTSPLVQIALIDLMVDIRERQSIEALKLLIQDKKLNPTVKERAEWGIQQLS